MLFRLPSYAALFALLTLFSFGQGFALQAEAGGLVRAPAVGGVYVDAEGVVSTPAVDSTEALQAVWQAGLEPVPAELEAYTDLRFVSLRQLESKMAEAAEASESIADEIRYLAGLLRVKHVLVYPPVDGKPGDIVIGGPAEGWKVDQLGNTVGMTTGRPVLMLEDLIVALRAAESSNGPGISCSIDPTKEGLARAQQVQSRLTVADGPLVAARRLEQALGRQTVSVSGVPTSSHFARTLVAADFRMKRLAMGFEQAPVSNLPSYIQMVGAAGASKNILPRWWLAANYEPLARDQQGLAWEIRGQGVKCLAEEDFVDAEGNIKRGKGKATGASRWADQFTNQFDELAGHDSAFGHLRNALDLSVAAALMSKEGLWDVAQIDTPQLAGAYELEVYDAPKSIATKATFLKKGRKWVITASGGVQIYPWQIADKTVEAETLAPLREQASVIADDNWWWQ